MRSKKVLSGIMALSVVFAGFGALPYNSFMQSSAITAGAESISYTAGREFVDEARNENYVKSKFDVETEFYLVTIEGDIIPIEGTIEHYESNISLIDRLSMDPAEYKEIISQHQIAKVGARVTVKDMEDNKSYYIPYLAVSTYEASPDHPDGFMNQSSPFAQRYMRSSANVGAVGSDGNWHDDFFNETYSVVNKFRYEDTTSIDFTMYLTKRDAEVMDMSEEDAAAKPADRPVITDLRRTRDFKDKMVIEYYAVDAENNLYKFNEQPKLTETDRFIYSDFDFDLANLEGVCDDPDSIIGLKTVVSFPELKEGRTYSLAQYEAFTIGTYREHSNYSSLPSDYQYDHTTIGYKNADGDIQREHFYYQSIGSLQTGSMHFVVDKVTSGMNDTDYTHSNPGQGEYDNTFYDMPIELEPDFFLVDIDGNYYPISGQLSTSETMDRYSYLLDVPFEDYDAVADNKKIIGTAARFRVKDAAADKSYAIGTASVSGADYVTPSYSSSSSTYFYSISPMTNPKPNIGVVGSDGKWHDDIVVNGKMTENKADREKFGYENVRLSLSVTKPNVVIYDMTEADAAAKPESPVYTDMDSLSYDLPADIHIDYYAVDFDDNRYKLDLPEATENSRYIVSEITVTPDMIAEVCPLDQFKYLVAAVNVPGIERTQYVRAGITSTVEEESYLGEYKDTKLPYQSEYIVLGTENADAPNSILYESFDRILGPVVASRIDMLESATILTYLDKTTTRISGFEETKPDEPDEPDQPQKPDDEPEVPDEPDTTDGEDFIFGDLNGDGEINVTDVTMIAAYVKNIKGLSEDALKAADVTRDGEVNISDVTSLAAHVKGIRPIRSN
ncbi:dockerin type I repeat-containing protein [Ruminococcus sp.]|uniref:dockerin type I repeat-containing protein n=1 Tax=Ruminococcus sp. TaxID=41978 RepID=UPI0025F27730|nr:dockerin type I repeat-containing protein [Ruminococcus sp.]MBQ8966774.1 dockerin type I repeat-containing protein [Ruminococcus sp.]